MASNPKRTFPFGGKTQTPPQKKTRSIFAPNQENKLENSDANSDDEVTSPNKPKDQTKQTFGNKKSHAPLAEKMRPNELSDYVGQSHLIGPKTLLHDLLRNGEIPSMILWGPPGCGKTSLVNVIMQESKKLSDIPVKFIKLSATTSSINDVRKAVTEAENQAKQGRRTVVFMDEIHRFNKLQQDIFLPHVEAGTFILIGATTENPSSGLNSALLSRCRVFVLKKLQKENLVSILMKAIKMMDGEVVTESEIISKVDSDTKFFVEQKILEWLAEACDGDARVALGGLEMTVQARVSNANISSKPIKLNLNDVKHSLEKAQSLTGKKSDNISQLYSALHHSIVADEDNAALYWLARIMDTGEDPVYIARKLVRIASEDIGLADDYALGPNFKNIVREENLNKNHLPQGLENMNFFNDE
ncbi:ATPase WRNIP1 isoform X2 [Nasonia vitripennis]|uniref:AAA+ ATPase domain-containing protein n=1 Tax=Nasonia vitripennis TaxID=7425 RepID=A0A7M7QK00_NASVI|nr:ATPase WRNIP1 isoform X2 [Nasonia vitripennis]